MNAKTTKYLSVLAVLAVAFAGCVVLFQEQGSDAAAGEAVTKDTYATAYGTDKIFKSIMLETTADPKSVVLYTSGTEIVAGNAYFFADDAKVSIPETVTLNLPVMFFILDGVKVDVVGPSKDITGTFGLIEFVNVKAYESGVITLDAAREEAKANLFSSSGYAKSLTTVTDAYSAADAKITFEKGESFAIKADKKANPEKKFVLGEIEELDVYENAVLAGNIKLVNIKTENSKLTLDNFTGEIKSGTADIELKGFTGAVTGTTGAIKVDGWTAGKILYATGVTYAPIEFEQGNTVEFVQGVKIPAGASFSFTRYVSDEYKFTTTNEFTVGVGGFTISAGANGIELSGDVKAAALEWEFKGAATITGNIDATGTVNIIGDGIYDVTLGSLTVFTTGMTLDKGAAVADNATVNVRSVLEIPAKMTLKVGDKANVRVYQDDNGAGLKLAADSKIYTAGTLVADVITVGEKVVDDSEVTLNGIAYVYGSGSITGSTVKLAKVNETRMAYIDLTGAGILGINGTTMVNNGYYKYSFIAFYPVETYDVFNLAANSRIVESIEPYATVISYEKNLPLMYAKYEIDYTKGIPSFEIVYKETYTVTLNDLTKYTIKDSQNKNVYVEDVQGVKKAQLVYGETYTLTGKNSTSKYTFTFEPTIKKNEVSKTVTKFEQIRQDMTVYVAEGMEQTITIELEQDDSPFKTGDALLQYYVDNENFGTVKLTTKDDKLIGTFKVYNTDLVLINLVDKKYFKFAASNPTNIQTQNLTPEQVEAGWDYAFKGTDTTVTTGSAKVTYSLDVIKDTYVLKDDSGVGKDLRITVTFNDLYPGDKKHESTYTFAPTTAGYQLTVNTYKGETYSMAWAPIENVDEVMTYGDNKEYEQGKVVTIVNAGTAQAPAGTTYTLTLTPVKFAIVKNETAIPLTVVFAGKEIETLADKTNENGIIVGAGKVALESIGKEISSWTAEWVPKDSAVKTPLHGAGSTSVEDVDVTEGGTLTIKSIKYVNIVYLVTVQPTHHTTLTNYDQAGYYGRQMVAYEQINEEGYRISGVVYDYEIDGVKYTGEAKKEKTAQGQEYWTYAMPAADITLRPVEEQDQYKVTFIDQNDRELETFNQTPRTAFLKDVTEVPGAKAVAAVSTPQIGDFKFIEEDQTVSFTMPAANVVVKITYETKEYSEDVAVAITEKANGLWITVVALDGKDVMPGTITLTCTVWEYYEDLDLWYPEEYKVPAEVEGDSIVTGCTISFDKIHMGTAYVQAVYESFVADGDSGMIVYN